MKVEQQGTPFNPVTITFETREEVLLMVGAMYVARQADCDQVNNYRQVSALATELRTKLMALVK
jgi:hypothetical protein